MFNTYSQVKLKGKLGSDVKKASGALGFDEQKLVERAVHFYLDALKEQVKLKNEFNELDSLSDEALTNFEKNLK